MRRRYRAFTLVELLVVVGIISILVAMLMPALGRARHQANNLVCLNNVRQFGAAYQREVVENKGRAPRGDVGRVLFVLMSKVRPGQDQPVPLCPEASELSTRRWNRGQYDALLGTAHRAWGEQIVDASLKPAGVWWPGRNGCSYGANGWTYSGLHSALDPSHIDPVTAMRLIRPTTKDGSRVPLFADGMSELGLPLETDTPPSNLTTPNFIEPAPERPFGMKMFCMARHGRAVNVVFLDGHADTTPLEDLWKLKWHNQWVATEVTLPAR